MGKEPASEKLARAKLRLLRHVQASAFAAVLMVGAIAICIGMGSMTESVFWTIVGGSLVLGFLVKLNLDRQDRA